MARPLFVPNGQALLLALPIFCLQIDFLPVHVELIRIVTHVTIMKQELSSS